MARTCFVVVSFVFVVIYNVFGSAAVAASFQNGDFSSGFSGWQGEVGGVGFDPASGGLFGISTETAAIVKSDYYLFPVTLSQSFTLSLTATFLTFSLEYQATGPDDFVMAGLVDQGGLATPIDLFDGNNPLIDHNFRADISSLAGQDVQLYFTLLDLSYDFDPALFAPDVMKIDNIVIAQADGATPVPEPGSLLLVGAGLAGLAIVRNRKKALL